MASIEDNPVWKRTKKVFNKNANESQYANEYLAALRNNWYNTENSITRSSALMVGLAVLFEVSLTNKASGVSIFGFNVSNPVFIRLALPVIVAYLYCYITSAFIETAIFEATHDAIINSLYNRIYTHNLQHPLHPANSLFSSPDRIYYSLEGRARHLGSTAGGVRVLTIICAPPGFLILAYLQLLQKYTATNTLLWVSTIISAFFLVAAVINMYVRSYAQL